jgi:DNA repair protein RadC
MSGISLSELPPDERPRERLVKLGPKSLSTAELLAILLRTGVKNRPVMDLAHFLLNHFGSLEALSRASVEDLSRIKGVGPAKAIGLKAAFALAARLALMDAETRSIDQPEDVARLLGEEMRLLDFESVRVLCLNTKHKLLAIEEISRGLLNQSLFHPREAFRPAIARQAHAIVLVHNHPSGDPTPSASDVEVTKCLVKAGEILRIEVLDHVILGAPRPGKSEAFFSFKNAGMIK